MTEKLRHLPPDARGLAEAAGLMRVGGLVAFPTETVYGLGADAADDRAVARVFAAKGRPEFNPLIVHVAPGFDLDTLVKTPPEAERLADAFWPGPLTLVLPLRDGAGVSRLVSAGLPTLAVRVPDHAVARGLLEAFGGPVAAPSANPSGRISPTLPEHVAAGLGDRIDAVVEGGATGVGVESTILGFDPEPVLLRAGGLPLEAVEACLGGSVARRTGAAGRPEAPGQLASHYAPRAALRLGAEAARPGEVLLGFGPVEGAALNLSVAGDLTEAAANLFAHLHRLDAEGFERIAVAPIPEHGLGLAINDRLRRAAAPRR